MKKYSILAAVLLPVASFTAASQNLNPTVEVTSVYSSSAKDVVKPVQEMAVPDSVTQFNLKLDYSVFDNPYKGSYEFSPFVTAAPLQREAVERKQFYLRAGAGYTAHPEFEAVWSPVIKDRVRLDVTARHQSFFGDYRGLQRKTALVKDREVTSLVRNDAGNSFGYDALTDVGIRALYPWEKGEAYASASYTNLSGKDYLIVRSLNGVRLDAGVRSLGLEKFSYAVTAGWNHWGDYGGHLSPYKMIEDKLDLSSRFAFPMKPGGEIFARIGFTLDLLKGDAAQTAGLLTMTPGYRFGLGDWLFDLGVRFDVYMGAPRKRDMQFAFPSVLVSYSLLGGDMSVYASVTGGTDIHSYSDVVLGRHIFSPIHPVLPGSLLLDNTVERVRAGIGVKGHIARRFQYDFKTGYARVSNDLLDGIVLQDAESGLDLDFPLPGTGYAKPYHLYFADLDYAWISDKVKVEGNFRLRKSDLKQTQVFAPALLSGALRGSYTWQRRVTAGAFLDFSTGRVAKVSDTAWYKVPGYADLGVFSEYQIKDWIGVWGKVGNLLNTANQSVPLYASGGIWFSAGLTLTF